MRLPAGAAAARRRLAVGDVRRRAFGAAAIVAAAFLVLHLPFLPASLEDLDSINFALGLHQYDVALHQPHPPGYPVFIAVARAARHLSASDAHALSLVAMIAGALGVLALFALFRQFEEIAALTVRQAHGHREEGRAANGPSEDDERRRPSDRGPGLACTAALVAATSPLYWFTAARPLSDTAGLAAAVAVQAWTLAARTPASFAGAVFCAGLATGIRSQVAWLTVPLAIVVAYRRTHEVTRMRRALVSSWSWLWPFLAGCLVWLIPMIVMTGGPAAYWRALFSQGTEDLTGIQMLWTMPTPRVFVSALYYGFVAPWALWSSAVVAIAFAVFGTALMFRFWPRALVALAIAYGPYLAFDLLFQETFTTRYALPLVVPVAYLAVRGAGAFGWRPGLIVALVLSMFDAHVGGTSIAAYAREKAPAFRMLDDMGRSAAAYAAAPLRRAEQAVALQGRSLPVLAMDRREQLDLRRPTAWVGDRLPAIGKRLPSPPQHEWLEMVKYWNGGGAAPVWFVADPLRTDVDLVQHDDPVRYRWSVPYPVLLGGVRPNEMDWYRIGRPLWYVGEGWALTPEAAGVSDADKIGLAKGPIRGWANVAFAGGGAIVFGGRSFEPTIRPRLTIEVGALYRREITVAPGAFLHVERLPFIDVDSTVAEYQPVTVAVNPPSRVAIEQFDAAPPGRVVFGFGDGWHEQEYNPATGKRWRWLSEHGELRAMAAGQPITLHVEGESPEVYFSKPSRFVVRIGKTVAFDDLLSSDFSIDVTIPAELVGDGETTIAIETDQVYVPAERSSRTRDRRHLGLRIFKCEVRPVTR